MNFVKTCLAVLGGFLLGIALSHPRSAKAASPLYVKKVNVGLNPDPILVTMKVVGFSCTGSGDDAVCYVAASQ